LSGTPVLVANLTGSANTAASIEVTSLAWSTDGARLAYRADAEFNNQAHLYVVPTDGSSTTPKELVGPANKDLAVTAGLAWANATTLFFAGDLVTNNVTNLYFVDATAAVPSATGVLTEATLNASTKNVKGSVQRGSDGRIYFRSSHELTSKNSLYSCAADGTGVTKVAGAVVLSSMNVQADITAFRLSHNGASVAFTANAESDGLDQLYAMTLDAAAPSKRSAFTKPVDATTAGLFGGSLNSLEWSPDGSKVAVVGDWALLDNEYALYVLSATGATSSTRLLVPPTNANQNVDAVWFSSDGQRVLVLGDLVVNNDTELYAITDFTAADQTPTTVRVVSAAGGDVDGAFAH
ncbi:MAG: hypothetical protein FJ095_17105, partial [Deltaproteobacteria bacterium]|nr:hypothetical protein [Deltaproteobacteria bacterium]